MKTFGNLACLSPFLLLAAAGLPGCSSTDGGSGDQKVPNGIVRGRVTLDGVPMARVAVAISRSDPPFGIHTITNDDGEYEVRMHEGPGLPPGTYTVTMRSSGAFYASSDEQNRAMLKITQGINSNPNTPAPELPRTNIPLKYQRPETSGLVMEVISGDNPPFNFDLNSAD